MSYVLAAFGVAIIGVALLVLIAFERRERTPIAKAQAHAPGQLLTLSDGKTHYKDIGPKDGDVVLFVPGATLGLWVWGDHPEQLADAGYRVICYDLFGRGYSDRPHAEYDATLFERQITDLLDALKVQGPINIVALAFGCPISTTYALNHPGRIKRLCFFGPDGFGVTMSFGARLLQTKWIGRSLLNLIGNKVLLSRLGGYSSDPKVIQWLEKNYTPDLDLKGFKRALSSSVRNMPIHDASGIYKELDASPTEVGVLWGTQDDVTPIPPNFDPDDVFPHSSVRILDGVGHLPHIDAPDETKKFLFTFLQANEALTQ